MFDVRILDVFLISQLFGQRLLFFFFKEMINLFQRGAHIGRAQHTRAEFNLAGSMRGQHFVKLEILFRRLKL